MPHTHKMALPQRQCSLGLTDSVYIHVRRYRGDKIRPAIGQAERARPPYPLEPSVYPSSPVLCVPSRSPQRPQDTDGAEAVSAGRLHRLPLGQQANGALEPLVQRRLKLGVVALHTRAPRRGSYIDPDSSLLSSPRSPGRLWNVRFYIHSR